LIFRTSGPKMAIFRGKIGEGVGRYWPPTNSFLPLGVYISVSNLVKIDKEMRNAIAMGQIISLSVCLWVSEWVCQTNELNALQITVFNRSSNLLPRRCAHWLFPMLWYMCRLRHFRMKLLYSSSVANLNIECIEKIQGSYKIGCRVLGTSPMKSVW